MNQADALKVKLAMFWFHKGVFWSENSEGDWNRLIWDCGENPLPRPSRQRGAWNTQRHLVAQSGRT